MSDVIDGFGWLATSSNWWGDDGLARRTCEHLWYSLLAISIALVIAAPIGAYIGHSGRGRFAASSVSNLMRAVPTIGVVTVLYRWRPLGPYPIVALAILAVPPIMLGISAGIDAVDREVRDAARGMGLTQWQVLTRAELPCALPLALAGVRSAANQVIATATILGFFGLGGLGRYIFSGYGAQRYDEVDGAAIAVIALVLLVEVAFAVLQRLVVSPGIRTSVHSRPRDGRSRTVVPSITAAFTPSSPGGRSP